MTSLSVKLLHNTQLWYTQYAAISRIRSFALDCRDNGARPGRAAHYHNLLGLILRNPAVYIRPQNIVRNI